MKNSGLADSPFFLTNLPESESAKEQTAAEPDLHTVESDHISAPLMTQRNEEANHAVTHDTVIPRHHDTTVETVRLAVKDIGKEAATHRFTMAEKEAIAAIVYAYKRRGVRTSENEITRIAVHMLLQDHQAESDESLLERVLQALNA